MAGEGKFEYRDGIAVAQVVLFSVSLVCGVYFKFAHRIGWFCIGVFSLFRLVGASCMLGTIHDDSDGLWAGVFVCESLGMILLIFLLLEMLQRINKVLPVVGKQAWVVPQVLTWADIGVSIAGFVATKRSEHPLDPTSYSRAGIALLTAMYLWTAGVFAAFWRRRADMAPAERRAAMAVAACVPLMAVRVAYALVFVITADRTFNAVKGQPTPYLLMTMLPEVGIIGACTWTITKIPPLRAADEAARRQQNQSEEEDGQQNIPLVQQR